MADRRGYTSLYQNIPVQPLSGYSDPSAFIRVREAVRGLEDQVTQIRGLVGNSVPGYVSSVGLTAPTIFSVTGSPVTDTGTIALSLVSQTARSVFAAPTGLAGTPSFRALEAADIQSGVFGITRGGTGLSSTPTNGQLLIGNGSGYTLATLTAGTGISITNGVGSIQIDNTLPGFLNPMTTLGDIIYGGAAGAATRLGGETTTTRKFLRSVGVAGAATAPAWDTVTKTDVGLGNVEDVALSTWIGSSNLTTLGTIVTGVWSGTKIDVGYGGTGLTSVAANAILIGSTSTTLGTIGPPGSAGTYFLSYSSTLPGYQWTNTIDVADGGTGLTSYTVGDLLYASGTTTLAKLAVVDKGILYGTATGPAYTAAADMAWDNTNKRLGIGTATPSYPLHVEKNQNASTYTYLYNSDMGASARAVSLVSSDVSVAGLYAYSSGYTTSGGQVQAGSALGSSGSGGLSILAYNASGAIRFYTSSTSAFRGTVSSTGQWGFGPDATSPTALVSIAQYHNAATTAAVFNTDTGANASANFTLYTTATTGLELTSPGATNPNQLKLFSPLSGGVILEASNASGFLAVATGGTYPSSERFRIASNGNVTIDTNTLVVDAVNNRVGVGTSPSYRFHVSEAYTGASSAFAAFFANSVSPSAANASLQYGVYNTLTINANVTGSARAFYSILEHRQASNVNVLAAGMFGIDNNDANTMGSTITDAVAVYARTPSQNAMGGTITNSYGLYVQAQSGTNITTSYGVYQAGTSDKNIFAGSVRIGSTSNPSTILDIVQTVAGNAAVNMSNSSADPAANARYILNNSATSGGLQLRSAGHATEASDLVLYSTANNIRFYTGGNFRMSVGSTGNILMDTDTFFLDAANNRIGMGTATPQVRLHVDGTAATLSTTLYNNVDSILAVQNGGTGARLVSSTGTPTTITNVPALVMLTSRGTVNAATAVSSGDYLGRITWQGLTTTPSRADSSEIRAVVDAAPGAGAVPGRLEFWTAGAGSTTERMRIDDGGNVVVNTAALAVGATDGFLYIPTMPGAPTGTPTTYTGRSAIVFDTLNNRIYVYDPVDVQWRYATTTV